MTERSYAEAIRLAPHYRALGQTTVFIDDKGAPWEKASKIEAGCLWRLGAPVSFYATVEEAGLTIKWCFAIETKDANGRGAHKFAQDHVRDIMYRLPLKARRSMARILAKEVLPEVAKRTKEARDWLATQQDGEDFIRSIVATAAEVVEAE